MTTSNPFCMMATAKSTTPFTPIYRQLVRLHGEKGALDWLQHLTDELPHGSGIDSKWEVHIESDNDLRITNSFHIMNEDGYYDGWDFEVRVCAMRHPDLSTLKGPMAGMMQLNFNRNDIDVSVRFTGTRSNRASVSGLRDYLNDVLVPEVEKLFADIGILARYAPVYHPIKRFHLSEREVAALWPLGRFTAKSKGQTDVTYYGEPLTLFWAVELGYWLEAQRVGKARIH